MLKRILSISGKPGLYKLVSQAKNMIVVESLIDGKRMPSFAHDRVTSLGDIAMYTENDEVPLREVFLNIQKIENGGLASCEAKASPKELQEFMAKALPDYDRDRVKNSDIKKLITWYNLLVNSDNADFSEQAEAGVEEETEA